MVSSTDLHTPTQSQCLMRCHCLLQHHLGDDYQQMSTMTHQNLCYLVGHQTLTLTLTMKYLVIQKWLSHHYHLPMNPQNLHEMVNEGLNEV